MAARSDEISTLDRVLRRARKTNGRNNADDEHLNFFSALDIARIYARRMAKKSSAAEAVKNPAIPERISPG